jgi:hypothetical protein
MISPVSNASQHQPVDKADGASTKKPAKPTTPSHGGDSVQLSTAGLAALKKSPEASSQTANEGGSNSDH